MSNKSLANICAKHGFPEAVVDAMKNIVVGEYNELTGGIGFNGNIVDMDETPTDINTAAYPVGTLFISPA